jgi:hypothetical protein
LTIDGADFRQSWAAIARLRNPEPEMSFFQLPQQIGIHPSVDTIDTGSSFQQLEWLGRLAQIG